MNTKKFFSGLSWSQESGFICPIFKKSEIQQVPLKRLKHLLLVYTGLRSILNLNREIVRFKMSQSGLLGARKLCQNLLLENNDTPNSILLVIKVVFSQTTLGLPNYRVTMLDQLPSVFSQIEEIYLGNADELWLCVSNISLSRFNLGGRVALHIDSAYVPEVLEIVWFTSPRMLDNYCVGEYPYPYIRASRNPGRLSFVLDDLSIPSQAIAPNTAFTKKEILQDYHFVIRELELRRERVATLCEIFQRSHVKEVVLEFKIDNGQFYFIDWDTDIETKAIWRNSQR